MSDSGISWAICKCAPRSRQITMPAPHHSVFTGRMPFLPPNQQRQSTEGNCNYCTLQFIVNSALVYYCRSFSRVNVPRGSVATHIRCGGIFNKLHSVGNLLENLTVIFFKWSRINRVTTMSLVTLFLEHSVKYNKNYL